MRWPLRNQIMGPLLVVALASLAAVGALHARLARTHTTQRIEQQLRGMVGVLSTANFPLTQPVLQKMRDLSSAEFALTDAEGRLVATSFSDGMAGEQLKLPTEDAVARWEDVALGPPLAFAGRDYFHTAFQLAPRDGASDDRVLHVLFPRDEYRRSLRQAYVPPLVVGIAAVAAAALAARLLAGRISRATSRLGDEVVRLARGDFSPIALPSTDDEIRDLAAAVNRTAAMLADYEQHVRRSAQMQTVAQLGASLAHEMRNAATGCRMAVDLHAEACMCGADEESLAVARRQLRLMESQLQRLLQLGRRPAELTRRPVDVAALVEDLLPLVRPAASHAGVALLWRRDPGPVTIDGDEDALGQAALNLMLNAIEAAKQAGSVGEEAGRVIVELRRTAQNEAELSVADTGPGPAVAIGAAMFEPFVSSKAEGAGLGLAVARQVVEAHGGSIDWNHIRGVTRFRIVLPLAAKEVACV